MLVALTDGRALPASELASHAGLSAAAASAHLARLLDGGLLICEREGRHRYYRLASENVANVLEVMAGFVDARGRSHRLQQRPHPLRFARTCYDHLAGELGVALTDALLRRELLVPAEGKCLQITPIAAAWFARTLGIDVALLKPGRQGIARLCLDWTERRHHVAGPLGKRILTRFYEIRMVARTRQPRQLILTARGRHFLAQQLDLKFDGDTLRIAD
jgi:DNA-binding transcriptional ArsR family regulator